MARLFGVLLLSLFIDQVSAEWSSTAAKLLKCSYQYDYNEEVEYPSRKHSFDYYNYYHNTGSRYECEDATSATGGFYTTYSKECIVSFHKSSTSNHGAYKLADVCATENELEHIQSFVSRFPDCCVGQFARCYELETQNTVFASLLCSKGGQVPAGTTHVSVDCTADAAASKEKYGEYKKRREIERNFEMAFGIGIPVVLLLCCAGACFRYRVKLRSLATSFQEKWNNTSNTKGHKDWTICSVMCCGILFVMKRLHNTPEMSGLLARAEEIQLPPVDGRTTLQSVAGEVA